VGDAMDENEVPQVELSHAGDTRLVRMTYTSGGTSIYSTSMIWDTSFDTSCYPRVIDGKTYCVPSGTYEMGPDGNWFC
jgi:hypothetical protein